MNSINGQTRLQFVAYLRHTLIPSTNAAALVSASIAELGQILDTPAKIQPQTPATPTN